MAEAEIGHTALRGIHLTTLNKRKTGLRVAGVIAALGVISTIIAQQPRGVDAKVLTNAGTAKDALDLLVKDWTKVFKQEGK